MCTIATYLRRTACALATSLCVLAMCAPAASGAPAPPPAASWETVMGFPDNNGEDKLEITSRDGYIYVATARELNVRVYTILGQLVSSQTLPPGVSRLRIKARGIYILKADNQTRRITV